MAMEWELYVVRIAGHVTTECRSASEAAAHVSEVMSGLGVEPERVRYTEMMYLQGSHVVHQPQGRGETHLRCRLMTMVGQQWARMELVASGAGVRRGIAVEREVYHARVPRDAR